MMSPVVGHPSIQQPPSRSGTTVRREGIIIIIMFLVSVNAQCFSNASVRRSFIDDVTCRGASINPAATIAFRNNCAERRDNNNNGDGHWDSVIVVSLQYHDKDHRYDLLTCDIHPS